MKWAVGGRPPRRPIAAGSGPDAGPDTSSAPMDPAPSRAARATVEDVRDDLAAIVEAAPRAGGDRCVRRPSARRTRQPANSAVSRTMMSGRHCSTCRSRSGTSPRRRAPRRRRDAPSAIGSDRTWRRVGEQLPEGGGAAGEVLVTGIGHALGERGVVQMATSWPASARPSATGRSELKWPVAGRLVRRTLT